MIKYNLNTINDWFFSTDNIIKVYRNNAICYYKIDSSSPSGQTPCFAVVDDISQYSDTEFEDVFNKADEKWYKLNNLSQYEEYGLYGNGRNITYYDGKLTVDDGYEYIYSGGSWVNVGEVSGSTYIEYLERDSSHNGYVPLGEYFTENTVIQIDFQMTQAKGNAIIGDYGTNDNNDWRVFLNYDSQVNNWLVYDFINSRNYYNTRDWSKRFYLEIGNYYIKDLNTDTYLVNATRKTSFTRPNQMYLFHMEGSQVTNNIDYGKIYSVKVYQNGTLVKDLVPWTDENGNYGLYDNVSSSVTQSIGSMTGATGGTVEYPIYYDEMQDPPNNLVFSSMAEAEAYECPWVGMNATIDGDKYVFSGDSSGYEWVEVALPYDAEIEYLESSGSQYINTNQHLNTSNFEIGYSVLGNRGHWGYVHNNVVNGAWVTVDETTAFFGSWNNTDKVSVSSYISSTENTIVYTQSGATINGTTISKIFNLRGVDNLASVPLLFFALHDFYNNSLIYSNSKFKSFYLKNNGTLVVDMIPVRVGQVGYMYDRVSGQLFGNAGTGSFILGPDK